MSRLERLGESVDVEVHDAGGERVQAIGVRGDETGRSTAQIRMGSSTDCCPKTSIVRTTSQPSGSEALDQRTGDVLVSDRRETTGHYGLVLRRRYSTLAASISPMPFSDRRR